MQSARLKPAVKALTGYNLSPHVRAIARSARTRARYRGRYRRSGCLDGPISPTGGVGQRRSAVAGEQARTDEALAEVAATNPYEALTAFSAGSKPRGIGCDAQTSGAGVVSLEIRRRRQLARRPRLLLRPPKVSPHGLAFTLTARLMTTEACDPPETHSRLSGCSFTLLRRAGSTETGAGSAP
jgi:hypothetical protein